MNTERNQLHLNSHDLCFVNEWAVNWVSKDFLSLSNVFESFSASKALRKNTTRWIRGKENESVIYLVWFVWRNSDTHLIVFSPNLSLSLCDKRLVRLVSSQKQKAKKKKKTQNVLTRGLVEEKRDTHKSQQNLSVHTHFLFWGKVGVSLKW